jgi:hypothetical protein
MKPFLLTLLLATLCATGYGQTIKSLGYNTTNGEVVYTGTNVLTFTNQVVKFEASAEISDLEVDSLGVANSAVFAEAFEFATTNAAATARTNLGLGWPALISSNAATSLLGLDVSNQVIAATNIIFTNGVAFTTNAAAATLANLGLGTNASVTLSNLNAQSISITNTGAFRTNINLGATWLTNTNADTFRTNIGIPLPALTNDSNVTTMRALAGSTNTNEPFSGNIDIVDQTSTTYVISVSNGIILSVQEP